MNVTIDTVNKTVEMTSYSDDKLSEAAKPNSSEAQNFGNYSVSISRTVSEKSLEAGKWLVTTTWDGAKWVSKKVWYPSKMSDKP